MTLVATTTGNYALGFGNQKRLDVTSNGVRWLMVWDGTTNTTNSVKYYYSTDIGATWALGGSHGFSSTSASYQPDGSFFIDEDDYAHVAYKDRSNGYIYYRRGTPNAQRTAYTWSAATAVISSASYYYPDIVAHREGTGWAAHVVYGLQSTATTRMRWGRLTITNTGTVTLAATTNVAVNTVATSTYAFPSIDFHHPSGSKSVKDATPHLYMSWLSNDNGHGIKFRKATYSGGTWTLGTEFSVKTSLYGNGPSHWQNIMYNGTNAVVSGVATRNGVVSIFIYDLNATEDAFIETYFTATGAGTEMYVGNSTYDMDNDMHFIGGTTNTTRLRNWRRSTNTMNDVFTITTGSAANQSTTMKRGYQNNKIEWAWQDLNASPWNIEYGNGPANETPVLKYLTPENFVSVSPDYNIYITWQVTDRENDPLTEKECRYREFGTETWTTLTGFTGSDNFITLPPNQLAFKKLYEIQVRGNDGWSWSNWSDSTIIRTHGELDEGTNDVSTHYDSWPASFLGAGTYEVETRAGTRSGMSNWVTHTLVSAQNTPPTVGGANVIQSLVLTNQPFDVEWTYADTDGHSQQKYQIRVRRT